MPTNNIVLLLLHSNLIKHVDLIGVFSIQFSDNTVAYFLLGHPVCTDWLFLWCFHATFGKEY